MGWLFAGLRRWRDDAAVSVVVALLVLGTALVCSLAPRILQRVDDDALATEVAALPQSGRGVALLQTESTAVDAIGPLSFVEARGADLETRFPPSVRALVRGTTLVVDAPRFELAPAG
ncbi:MAG TPA: hypothetical protein VEY67_03045, partial [Candidatus Dormibacteraeota bacterium]|nr:hypothetical protein [Candidatus Dormibacteraeota bacterium]